MLNKSVIPLCSARSQRVPFVLELVQHSGEDVSFRVSFCTAVFEVTSKSHCSRVVTVLHRHLVLQSPSTHQHRRRYHLISHHYHNDFNAGALIKSVCICRTSWPRQSALSTPLSSSTGSRLFLRYNPTGLD